MRQTCLAVVLALVVGTPMFAQPSMTGTWTGTANVVSALGYAQKGFTITVSSQSGNLFFGSYSLNSGQDHSATSEGLSGAVSSFLANHIRIASVSGISDDTFGAEGNYVAAVPLVSPARLVLNGWLGTRSFVSTDVEGPYMIEVTLTKQ